MKQLHTTNVITPCNLPLSSGKPRLWLCGSAVLETRQNTHDKQREFNFWNYHPQRTGNTLARGRNGLYRPLRVPPRRFGTCRAAVAALAGTDSKLCEQATYNDTSTKCSGSHLAMTPQYKLRRQSPDTP
jgi:hypothetical protein